MKRRSALGLLAAAPFGAAACATGAAGDASAEYVKTPNPLRDFVKMRGALDDRLVVGFLTGRYFGVTDAEMTPFYGVEAATFSKYQALPGGGYRAATFEIAYFTDLKSGAVLETWRNPYTDQDVTVPVTRTEPSIFTIGEDLSIKLAKSVPGMTLVHRALPARTVGNDVWMSEESYVTAPIPGLPKPFRYSEIVTMHAKRSDLDNERLRRVPVEASYVSAVSWRPWQKMGDRPGTLSGQADGLIGARLDLTPATWRSETQKRFPQIYADPGASLSAVLAAAPI